jgi:hypothetical protein
MWIFLPFGFFSIVAKGKNELVVRGRARADLEAFAQRVAGAEGTIPEIVEHAGTDYAFRFEATRADVTRVLSTFIAVDLDYGNFKDEVAKHDAPRCNLYHEVWVVLRNGLGALRRPARRGSR